eukprot:scaffold1295_cov220-Pinguiococcus_pyrenoidosus.AAC.3
MLTAEDFLSIGPLEPSHRPNSKRRVYAYLGYPCQQSEQAAEHEISGLLSRSPSPARSLCVPRIQARGRRCRTGRRAAFGGAAAPAG